MSKSAIDIKNIFTTKNLDSVLVLDVMISNGNKTHTFFYKHGE